ncbi:oligosaccharide flippase family protein [Ligilactobacillus sp. LYQ139]
MSKTKRKGTYGVDNETHTHINDETTAGTIATAKQQDVSAKEKMLRGSSWLTIGSIFSRILGAIYVIPWYAWLGPNRLQANALYTKGYTLYSTFLMISTAGVPDAVSKQVAHYNSKNEYGIGRRLYRKCLTILTLFGIICAGIMWIGAPYITQGSRAVIPVYRSLAVALIIIPALSLTRGYFQGYQDMAPSALSQLVEQVARITYILLATFLIMRVWHGSYQNAVIQSTFAAFIGAGVGLLLLVGVFVKKRKQNDLLVAQSDNKLIVSDGSIIRGVIRQSIPFIIVGAAFNAYNLVDLVSFQPVMQVTTGLSVHDINNLYALFAGNANKLIMIVVSLAIAMGETSVPVLSELVTKGNVKLVKKQLIDAIEIFLLVMLPAALGMAAISRPVYVLFYGFNFQGIFVLCVASYTAIGIGLASLMGATLQGMYENKRAVRYALIGFVTKIVIQIPLTVLLHAYGPLLATGTGMLVAATLMFRYLYYAYNLNIIHLHQTFNSLMKYALIMFAVVLTFVWLSGHVFNIFSRFQAVITIIIAGIIGAALYGYLCLRSRVADDVLGSRAAGLRRVFHIR